MDASERVRNLIIAIVSVIVVAVVATVIVILTTADKPGSEDTLSGDAEPIIVSSLGVGTRNNDAEDLDIYFSYTCHACSAFEVATGEQLMADVAAGKFNLIYHPVASAAMEFLGPATSAALVVAEQDPEHFVAFHHALMVFSDEQVNQKADPTIVTDLAASSQAVKEIAKEVGVPDQVIAQFTDNADAYMAAAAQNWNATDVEGRPGFYTPEIVFMDTYVERGSGSAAEQYAFLIKSIDTIRDSQQ